MPRILMVSKPVAPPWNDSSKNLVRDVASHLVRHSATIMVARGSQSAVAGVHSAPVYAAKRGRFAPGLADNARVMLHLVTGAQHDVWHFFFAPNPRSSAAGRWAARLRRVATVQTVCSAPAENADVARLLFADRTIVLSRYTEQRVLAAGVPRAALRYIPPAVSPLDLHTREQAAHARDVLGLPQGRALIVFPGDLEVSGAAERVLRAHAVLRRSHDVMLAMACRAKTAHAHTHEVRLRELSESLGSAADVAWLGETAHIHALLGTADIVALPAENLYAKMDLPLVLIEAMLLGRPVLTAIGTPAQELCEDGAALAVAPDVEATTDVLARLLGDEAERRALGERARRSALSRFHPANVAEAYGAVYDELLQ
jgi:glycosyltransferase involved in cell wall biosynthesis